MVLASRFAKINDIFLAKKTAEVNAYLFVAILSRTQSCARMIAQSRLSAREAPLATRRDAIYRLPSSSMLLYAAFCVTAYPVSQFSGFRRKTSWYNWLSCFPRRSSVTWTQWSQN